MQQKHVNQAIAYLDQYKSPWCSPKKVVTTGSNSTSPFHWARGQAVGAGQNVRFVVAAIQPGPLQGVNMKSYIHIISFHVIRYHFISWHVISYDIHNHTNIYIYIPHTVDGCEILQLLGRLKPDINDGTNHQKNDAPAWKIYAIIMANLPDTLHKKESELVS